MTNHSTFIGIDISKTYLDVHFLHSNKPLRLANTKAGCSQLLRRLAKLPRAALGLEASGGYERLALRILTGAGHDSYLLDPARVRAYSKARGQRAKTDAIDAEMIARCLKQNHETLRPYIHDPVRQKLAELVAFRASMVKQAAKLSCQIEQAELTLISRMLKTQKRQIKARIVLIEKTIADIIASSPELAQKDNILRSMPGVGPVLGFTLLARLPELGNLDGRKIAALCGLAPFACQSGKSTRSGHCQAGRSDIRSVLYMAALSATRMQTHPLARFAERLSANAKPFKVTITAVMRKMINILNAMLRDNKFWNEDISKQTS